MKITSGLCFALLLAAMGTVSCDEAERPPQLSSGEAGSFGGSHGIFPGFSVSGRSAGGEGGASSGRGSSAFDAEGCAEATSAAVFEDVTLIFLLDRSSSMVGDSRWGAVTLALTEYIQSERARGTYAAISLFPALETADICDPDAYEDPVAGLASVPAVIREFVEVLSEAQPSGGSTPMATALLGASELAKKARARYNEPTAIVLVTDGAPGGCPFDTFEQTQAVAADIADTIPTYVIGVGDQTALDAIAEAGGTGRAVHVNPRNPETAVKAFQNQIARIGSGSGVCSITLPEPPEGSILHPDLVNVEMFTDTGSEVLNKNPGCDDGSGWQYDDPKEPTSVELCDATCDTVLTDLSAEVEVVFGCQTLLR